MPHPRKAGADWNAIRNAYVARKGKDVRALARIWNLHHSTILERAKKEGWLTGGQVVTRHEDPTEPHHTPATIPPALSPVPFPGKQKKSPARIEQIIADFSAGLNRTVVCARNAITLSTLRDWEAEDEEFAARILHAQAQFPAECVTAIRADVARGNAATAFTVLRSHPLTRNDFAEHGKGASISISLNIPLPGTIPPPNGYAQGAEPVTIEHEPEAA